MKRIAASMPDALVEGVTAHQTSKGLPSWSAALNEIVASALQIDVALPEQGGARPGAGQKPGGKMDHKAIVEAYLKFWPVAVDATDYHAVTPIRVAMQTLNQANRKLFPDREALMEAVAGAVMDACDARNKIEDVMVFAELFVGNLPQIAIDDPAYFAPGSKNEQLMLSMYARMAKQG